MTTSQDRDYVLGTHDEEIARLGLQHRIWRPQALAAWRRAGLTVGQTVLDLGCGPGYASVDLAEIVGPGGKVEAVDRSRRFLDHLTAVARHRGLGHVAIHERDLEKDPLPAMSADLAWSRWVFSFVRGRRELVRKVRDALRPGGRFVLLEYLDYRTWRYAPRCLEHESFVQKVMETWRAEGGEADVALELNAWLQQDGFEIVSFEPIVHTVSPRNYVWQWARAFLETGPERMVGLGTLTRAEADAIAAAHAKLEANPHALLITPAVAEIIAVKK
jgi:SAM-dependent methyltransferase